MAVIQRPALWQPPAYDGSAHELMVKTQVLITRIEIIAERHQQAKFASSLAAEDMVLTDIILQCSAHIRARLPIFTLQTGRLPQQTLQMLEQIHHRYGYQIAEYAPLPDAIQQYVIEHGLNGIYDSIQLRKTCCQIRKVEPLQRALADADAWITGQRRSQSVTRNDLPLAEHDQTRGIAKYNPLADWSEAEVWAYLREHDVPVNALHAQGYPSIGCDPCTAPVKAGEDIRSGRWWWESRETRECGLHILEPVYDLGERRSDKA